MFMADLDKMTWSKIDKFFDHENTEIGLDYFSVRLKKEMDEVLQERCNQFAGYMKDEFRLLYADLVRTEVKRVVQALLSGDVTALEEFNLAPADWGLKCDPLGIRRKVVEDNKDVIYSTEMQSLREELLRAQDRIKMYQEYR